MAGELDVLLRREAASAVDKRGRSDAQWRLRAAAFWTAFEGSAGTCDSAGVRKAHRTCAAQCDTKFARRDLAELQALTKGEPPLPVTQPEFSCAPTPALELFVAPDAALIGQLFPPGHARRSDRQ